ncbi:hypothetical protein H4R19_005429, partial [Coemansia spiralis]
MKLTIAPILLAAAVLAQQGPETATNGGESTLGMPGGEPAVSTIPSAAMMLPPAHASTVSLLWRLASYFDLSHVANTITTMPVMMAHVFDPTSGKTTMLAASVMRAGDGYYMPVCPVSSIAQAGSVPAIASQLADCGYGIQLTPLPQNAA